MTTDRAREALAWQVGVWDRLSEVYPSEIDSRFAPVVDAIVARAGLKVGQRVLDFGTGTGTVAQRAASPVGSDGEVIAVDVSPAMLAIAQRGMDALGITYVVSREGCAEALPVAEKVGHRSGAPPAHASSCVR